MLGVNAGCQKHGGGLPGLLAQVSGGLAHGQCMEVGNHVQAFIFLLQNTPVAHRTNVVAKGEGTSGLDAG